MSTANTVEAPPCPREARCHQQDADQRQQMRTLEGTEKKPAVLARKKNMGQDACRFWSFRGAAQRRAWIHDFMAT